MVLPGKEDQAMHISGNTLQRLCSCLSELVTVAAEKDWLLITFFRPDFSVLLVFIPSGKI